VAPYDTRVPLYYSPLERPQWVRHFATDFATAFKYQMLSLKLCNDPDDGRVLLAVHPHRFLRITPDLLFAYRYRMAAIKRQVDLPHALLVKKLWSLLQNVPHGSCAEPFGRCRVPLPEYLLGYLQ
jgi:hypothetical protein